MHLKKIILGILLFSSLPIDTQGASYHDMRTQGLIYLGLVFSIFGTHQLTKRSENNWRTFTDIASGLTLLTAGIITIACSGQLVHDLDQILK